MSYIIIVIVWFICFYSIDLFNIISVLYYKSKRPKGHNWDIFGKARITNMYKCKDCGSVIMYSYVREAYVQAIFITLMDGSIHFIPEWYKVPLSCNEIKMNNALS